MCGICGVVNFAQTLEVTEEIIIKMRDTMVHRGPDDAGTWVAPDRKIGLGHRRLSIVDLSHAGRQPMCNEDETVWIVFNGEIYNHRRLRKPLEEAGHRYRSNTDTETLIHLYEEKGIEFVNDLEGMFAIALWDSNKQKLFLIRDRIGIKPLYYNIQPDKIVFGSEIKAILAHPAVRRDIDPVAMYHYLTFVTTPAPFTMFQDIRKLEPGCYLEIDGYGKTEKVRYWDAAGHGDRFPELRTLTGQALEDYCVREIRRLLTEAIEKRMMSDVPFGVFLSGGIDSSANVALMSRMMDRPVDTFTVGFKEEEEYNELQYARQIAREFQTNHHEILIGYQDLIDYLPNLIHHQDEPVADWVCVPLYYVSKLARDSGTIVVQVGEGSDEQFCGYDGYMHVLKVFRRYWGKFNSLSPGLKKALAAILTPLVEFTGKGKGQLDLLRMSALGQDLFWGGAIAFLEREKREILNEFLPLWENLSSYPVVGEHLQKVAGKDLLYRMIYLELKIRLPELLLMRVDKVTMSTSIEARVPFLDHKLVEFTMNIPSELKTKGNVPKYILKKACEGIIPDNIIYRKKMGFGAPVREWFWDRLGRFAEETTLNSGLMKQGFLKYSSVARMWHEHKSQKADHSFKLWNLLNLAMWYDYWIEGKDRC